MHVVRVKACINQYTGAISMLSAHSWNGRSQKSCLLCICKSIDKQARIILNYINTYNLFFVTNVVGFKDVVRLNYKLHFNEEQCLSLYPYCDKTLGQDLFLNNCMVEIPLLYIRLELAIISLPITFLSRSCSEVKSCCYLKKSSVVTTLLHHIW